MKGNQKGFTLLELVIAVAILALVSVPIFSSCILAARYTTENDLRADCLRLAENEMELQKANLTWIDNSELHAGEPVCLSVVGSTSGEGELDGKNIRVEAESLEISDLYAITVTVAPAVEDGEPPFEIVLKGVCVKR